MSCCTGIPFRGPVYDFIFIAFKYLNVTSIRIKLIEEKEKKFLNSRIRIRIKVIRIYNASYWLGWEAEN